MFRFDQFTERAQDAAARARDIFLHFGHSQVDTEHLFLALIEQPDSLGRTMIEKLGVDPNTISDQLSDVLRASLPVNSYADGVPAQVPLTTRIAHVLEVANQETSQLKDEHIGTEHLFLAISTERDTPSASILANAGITHDKLMDIVKEIRGESRR